MLKKQLPIKAVHQNLKNILSEFNSFCVKSGIKYSLFAGTLLGAIREKGFIAWDDDADIMMEREEFNRLLKTLPPNFNIIYILWVPRLVYRGTNKLEGGNSIDIFVFDNVPHSSIKHNLKLVGLRALQGSLKENIKWSKYSLKEKMLLVFTYSIGKLFSKQMKLSMYEYLAQLDNNKNSHYICPYKNAFAYMHKYKKEMVAEYMMIPFEDITLMSMKGYHECLTTAYGDYMKPPPKEERKPMHGNATI